MTTRANYTTHRTGKRWRWAVVHEPLNAWGPRAGAEFPGTQVKDAVKIGFIHDGYVMREERTGLYWLVENGKLHRVELKADVWERVV